jgi:hypothetical protein
MCNGHSPTDTRAPVRMYSGIIAAMYSGFHLDPESASRDEGAPWQGRARRAVGEIVPVVTTSRHKPFSGLIYRFFFVGSSPASTALPVLAAPSPASSSVCDIKPAFPFCAAMISPEGSRLLSYLYLHCLLPVPICIAAMSVTNTSHGAQALTLVFG